MSLNLLKPAGEIVNKLLGKVDSLITSKEEKQQLSNDFTEIINQNTTARHKTDMISDSWLSKNIRPATLIYILLAYTIFSLIDGNIKAFTINSEYVKLLGEWGKAIMYFYFGGRTLEKGIEFLRRKK